MENYYDFATREHPIDLYKLCFPLQNLSTEILEKDAIQVVGLNKYVIPPNIKKAFQILALLYGYESLVNPPGYPQGVAGWHSHFPRSICLITEGVNPNRQIKTICHEIAHCIQSHAVETLYGYKHQGEIASDFDTYLRYEIAADALAYEVYLEYFDLSIRRIPYWSELGVEELDPKNFQSYSNTEGVCRLYRKWAMKMRRKGYMR